MASAVDIPNVLGVDPGSKAAGVVLLAPDGRQILGAWSLVHRKRKRPVWAMRASSPDGLYETERRTLHECAWLIWQFAARRGFYHLAIEGLFVPRKVRTSRGKVIPTDPQSVLPLAEAAGELRGPLSISPRVGTILRPPASEWRPGVLGIPPRTGADQAEQIAVGYAATAFDGLAPFLDRPHGGHVAEAAWIALYDLRFRPSLLHEAAHGVA